MKALKAPPLYAAVVSVTYALTSGERAAVLAALKSNGATVPPPDEFIKALTQLVAEYRSRRAATSSVIHPLRDRQRDGARLAHHVKKTGDLPPTDTVPMNVKRAVWQGTDAAQAVAQYRDALDSVKAHPGQPERPDDDALISAVYDLIRSTGCTVEVACLCTEAVLIACRVPRVPSADDGAPSLRRAIERARSRKLSDKCT